MRYFYYVRWWMPEGELPEGLYHSRFVSNDSPREFLANVVDAEFIGEYYIKQFKSEAELLEYWNTAQ